jgi:hypothetical protein
LQIGRKFASRAFQLRVSGVILSHILRIAVKT